MLQFSVVPLHAPMGGAVSSPLHDEADDLINELGARGGGVDLGEDGEGNDDRFVLLRVGTCFVFLPFDGKTSLRTFRARRRRRRW